MKKQFLTLILMITILGMNPTFATEQKTSEGNTSSLTISGSFNFKEGDQETLNKWVAKNGIKIYRYLNNSPDFGYPEETKNPHYYTFSQHWRATIIENQIDFIKKNDITASTAIRSILESEGRFDCRIAQRIVFMECMRRLMGDKAFDECNQQFEAELSQDIYALKGETKKLHLCGGITLNPYFRLTCQETSSLYRSGIIGYFGYIPNVKIYEYLHPYGLLRGDHALLCSDPGENKKLYVGYGSFYQEGGLCWNEVVKRFKNETLTLPLPEKPDFHNDKKVPRSPVLIQQLERLNASELQRKKDFIEKNMNHYEMVFGERQRSFSENSASYYIDFKSLRERLCSVEGRTS